MLSDCDWSITRKSSTKKFKSDDILPLAPPSAIALFPQDSDVNARPIVRADCIKFVYTFRNQFSVEQLLALMPMLIAHLQSEHVSCLPSCRLYSVLLYAALMHKMRCSRFTLGSVLARLFWSLPSYLHKERASFGRHPGHLQYLHQWWDLGLLKSP